MFLPLSNKTAINVLKSAVSTNYCSAVVKCSCLYHIGCTSTQERKRWKLTFLLVKRGQHRSVATHFEVDLLLGANRKSSWRDNYSHACVWAAQCAPLVGKHPPGRGHHLLTVTPLTNFSSTPMVMWKYQVSSPHTPHPHTTSTSSDRPDRKKQSGDFISSWWKNCQRSSFYWQWIPHFLVYSG
jgi:hypothetical protein